MSCLQQRVPWGCMVSFQSVPGVLCPPPASPQIHCSVQMAESVAEVSGALLWQHSREKRCLSCHLLCILVVSWSLCSTSRTQNMGLEGTSSEEVCWPDHVENVQIFPSAGFECLFFQYLLYNKSLFFSFFFPFFSVILSLWHCHVGSLFTNEEQKNKGSLHTWMPHTQMCSWCQRLCQNGSTHKHVFVTSKRWFLIK